jgi:hypothetical protein
MSAAVILCIRFLSGRPVLLLVPIGIVAGGLTYVLTMAALRVPELAILTDALRRRLIKN